MDERRAREGAARGRSRKHAYPAGHVGRDLDEGVEPDFSDDDGTTDALRAVEAVGTVQSLEDAEAAEAVTARVEGVSDVWDELEIADEVAR